MDTTRRGFLKNVGAGTLGAWLVPLLPWRALAQESIRAPHDPRLANHFLSVCRQCPQGCGVLAEVVGGRVKKLRGNPLHPTNRGTLCARGVSATQLLYNPDRIPGPLRRAGERGEGRWEPIGWDEALALVAEKLTALRGAGRPEGLAVLADQLGGLEGTLARRFCRAFGTENLLDLGRYPASGGATAAAAMQGVQGPVVFDLANASYLLSFNVPFLEASRNPIQTWQGFAEFRAARGRPRGRFVHFSPARDLTASKADLWVPIRPGTEGAVALGIAYVMLQEGLYDHPFVRHRCDGFADGSEAGREIPGFHRHVREHYRPARVAELSGVPVERLVALAREFALAQAPLALWQDQAGVASQPLAVQMAVHSLNALVGNIDAPGGVLVPRTLPDDLPGPAASDAAGETGLARGPLASPEHSGFPLPTAAPWSFPGRALAGDPYPLEAVLVYRANPVFDQLNGGAFRELFQKVPFSASIAAFHNDTTAWCDLVLPESHALESWYAGVNHTDGGHPFFNLAEPVVAPRHDTRHAGDVLLELGRLCGGPMAESLPWARFQDAAFTYLGRINGLQAGDLFGRPYEEVWTRLLERMGWRARAHAADAEFWAQCLGTGGWWDPIYFHGEWERSLPTPSGRFELAPSSLREGEASRRLPHHPQTAAGDPPDDAYPFHLLVYAYPHLSQVESPNQPWLQEISGEREREHWETWLDIHPEDAERLHLTDRAGVWVESRKGRVRLRCRFDQGVQPGTVRIPFGLGHDHGGRWMRGIGVTPTRLVAEAFDPSAGTPDWQSTSVRLQKA